jgi:predicted TIM-barrel fold metal-dependent hydrolase
VWNDWAWEQFSAHQDRMIPAGSLATADLEGSIAEVQRLAKLGFKCLTLPCKPIWGAHDSGHVNYNLPHFDPLWAAIQDANLPITFHVSTGRDPRAARGNGGAVVNYVSHSLSPTIEPVANLCASGVLERFPKLRFATIEAGIGWVPWLLGAMDEAYKKHHFWVRPKLQGLPSDYYRAHGFSSFQEDKAGLDLAESHGLDGNFMWANDYPHHEGTWPHSAEAIERTMGQLSDGARAKVLGLNCARFLGIEVPARYRAN